MSSDRDMVTPKGSHYRKHISKNARKYVYKVVKDAKEKAPHEQHFMTQTAPFSQAYPKLHSLVALFPKKKARGVVKYRD